MSLTNKVQLVWGAGSDMVSGQFAVPSDSLQEVDRVVTNGTNNFALGLHWAATKLKAIIITVTKDCTLYVNDVSGGSPTDTIPLKADCPFMWVKEGGAPSPIAGTAGAVTNAYLTVPSSTPAADCEVVVRAAVDL